MSTPGGGRRIGILVTGGPQGRGLNPKGIEEAQRECYFWVRRGICPEEVTRS